MTLPLNVLELLPTSALSEADLVTGYRHEAAVIVERPCACGGVLTADRDDPDAIVAEVRRHQRTTRHQAWRARG